MVAPVIVWLLSCCLGLTPERGFVLGVGVPQNAGQYMVEQLKIKSQKDRALLDIAKKEVYKQGFYTGTLLLGEFTGRPVQEAKPLVRELLLTTNQAIKYCEPDAPVVSRSGDLVCHVELHIDQCSVSDFANNHWSSVSLRLRINGTFAMESQRGELKSIGTSHDATCTIFDPSTNSLLLIGECVAL
jgi:leucyl-tRNA synthetase